jgi:hypothetical protein
MECFFKIQQVYDTFRLMFDVCTVGHVAHIEGRVQHKANILCCNSKNFKLRLGNFDTGLRVKEKRTSGEEMQRIATLLKSGNEVITEKMRITQTIL